MAYGLTIGTERATVLQNAIQDELTKRGYSPDADPVMAEYITIMIINNKTAAQIASELEDLIGSDFDPSFVDWLFAEVEKGAPEAEAPKPAVVEPTPPTPSGPPAPSAQSDSSRRPPHGPRSSAPLYQQAIAQAIPSSSPSAQKRSASARSPSPTGHVNKSRRLDLPTGPRAMQREGNAPGGSRSLLDRMGPSRNGHTPYPKDDIQARIDNITGPASITPEMQMMMAANGFPMNGMPGMDMSAMANPLMLQEMFMSNMALMTQMAGAMGMFNGMPMANFPQGVPADAGVPNGMHGQGGDGRGRGRGRGGSRGAGPRGRGGHAQNVAPHPTEPIVNGAPESAHPPVPVVAPQPVQPVATPSTPSTSVLAPQIAPSTSQQRSAIAPPERPQSPTLCKFGLKCTNALCRWSHPSPVATPESGVVLSNDPCENGKNCKDKDCIKAHVSPATLKPNAESLNPKAAPFTPSTHVPHTHHAPATQSQIPCRFGAACTRPGCTFTHPNRQSAVPCRFGSACTKATCAFQHPEGRVLPNSFHRGLGTTGGMVTVSGTDTTARHNKSVTFNTKPPATAAELEKRVQEVEEKKKQAKAAVAQAQAAAAAAKKEDSAKPVTAAA